MFEKTSKLAEKVASSLSRRHFLGSVGRWAGATALAMAGVLTNAGTARAGSKTCCEYGHVVIPLTGPDTTVVCGLICLPAGTPCPTTPPTGCSSIDSLLDSFSVGSCGDCKPLNGNKTPTVSP
jgi:hypothetical protein